MSRRIQCRALLLALALGFAHAVSPAQAATASRRPVPSVDPRSPSFNLLSYLFQFVDGFLVPGLIELKDETGNGNGSGQGGQQPTPPPPPVPTPAPETGPIIDPSGNPGPGR